MELIVPTLDYRLAAEFWDVGDPRLAIRTHAVVGGTPAYRREFAEGDTPADLNDFDSWVLRTVLNPSSPLFREARYLLTEETRAREIGIYQSTLAAVALGNNTSGGIASYVGKPSSDITHYLTVLEDCGLLRRDPDAFRANRTLYRIAEPLINFYQAILRPDWTDWERGRDAQRLWRRRQHRFDANVLGPHFEDMCRTWARFFAPESLFGGHVTRVGSGLVNDPENRTGHEVDIAVFGETEDGTTRLLSIGEAKWNDTMGIGHLNRLRRVRDVLNRGNRYRSSPIIPACYSGAGFMPALHDAARTGEVVLIGPEELYARP